MRDKFFKMRVTEKERKLLRSIAKKWEGTESDLIREAVFCYITRNADYHFWKPLTIPERDLFR